MIKQLFLDILVVVLIPVLAVGAYFLWFRIDSGPLLSAKSEMLRTDAGEPGNTTKIALQALSRIVLNDALFTSPTYLNLKLYTVDIPTSEFSREYPFTPSQTVHDMLRRSRAGGATAQSDTSPARVQSISLQLDLLRDSELR
jgi:hypothetical protein